MLLGYTIQTNIHWRNEKSLRYVPASLEINLFPPRADYGEGAGPCCRQRLIRPRKQLKCGLTLNLQVEPESRGDGWFLTGFAVILL